MSPSYKQCHFITLDPSKSLTSSLSLFKSQLQKKKRQLPSQKPHTTMKPHYLNHLPTTEVTSTCLHYATKYTTKVTSTSPMGRSLYAEVTLLPSSPYHMPQTPTTTQSPAATSSARPHKSSSTTTTSHIQPRRHHHHSSTSSTTSTPSLSLSPQPKPPKSLNP